MSNNKPTSSSSKLPLLLYVTIATLIVLSFFATRQVPSVSSHVETNNNTLTTTTAVAPTISTTTTTTISTTTMTTTTTTTTSPPENNNNAVEPPPVGFQNPPDWTFVPFTPPTWPKDKNRIAKVAVLKREQNYLSDWVKYHLAIGFDLIYIYDNEDLPTYAQILRNEGLGETVIEMTFGSPYIGKNWSVEQKRVVVKHMPARLVEKTLLDQHRAALQDWWRLHAWQDGVTHVAHWDIDEYPLLKNHKNIREFVDDYMNKGGAHFDDTCAAISLNWKKFGTNGLKKYSPEPVPIRFTCGTKPGRFTPPLCKLFSRVDAVDSIDIHFVLVGEGKRICDVRGKSVCSNGLNENFTLDVIQLNHYQAHTIEEYAYLRRRGSSIVVKHKRPVSEMIRVFNSHNHNDVQDFGVRDYFLKHVWKLDDETIKNYPVFKGSKCGPEPPIDKLPGLE